MVIMSSMPPPSEGVDHVQVNTQAFVDQNCLGNGTLYIAKERVSWCGENGQGFSLEYTAIAVHAVCKDTSRFPHECIYCMLDSPLNETNEDDEESKISEVRFVPEDKGSLEQIFNVLSDCQALHPDPQEEAEEEMAGFGGEYFTGEGDVNLTEQGQAILQRLENSFQQSGSQETTISGTDEKETNGHNHADQVLPLNKGKRPKGIHVTCVGKTNTPKRIRC